MKVALALIVVVGLSVPAHAAGKTDAQDALAAATKAEDAAAKFGNRWASAEAALRTARSAMDSGDWDHAVSEASRARALAERAAEQSREEETAWRDAVIR